MVSVSVPPALQLPPPHTQCLICAGGAHRLKKERRKKGEGESVFTQRKVNDLNKEPQAS